MADILHVIGQLEYGGVSSWLRNLRLQTIHSKISMDICCNYRKGTGELTNEFEKLGCRVFHIPLSYNPFSYIKNLRALIRENRYSVIHDHRSYLGGASLMAASMEGVKKRICFHHTPNDDRSSGLFRMAYEKLLKYWALKYATDIWACSNAVKIAHYGSRTDIDKRVKVIRSAIVLPKATVDAKERIRKEFSIPIDAKVICFVGRTTAPKNPLMAVNVLRKILYETHDTYALFVGDGPLLSETKALSAGIDRLIYTGFRNDVSDILAASDIMFQPSQFEGLPLTTLEALSLGVPVVGSTAAGLLEALPDELKTYCAPANNIEQHFNNIKQLLDILIANNSRPNYSQFLQKYSPEIFAHQVITGYDITTVGL